MNTSKDKKAILLTGAGFNKDFGGYLSKDIWSLVFNHNEIHKHPKIKNKLRGEFNFEKLYYEILDGDFSHDEKNAIKIAIREAYRRLDDSLIDYGFTERAKYIYELTKFIERFSAKFGESGYFFTLNQDLFVERYFSGSETELSLPGVDNKIWTIGKKPFSKEYSIAVPANFSRPAQDLLSSSSFHYIKLHGSYNWNRTDDSEALVIGVQKEPILAWYWELFQNEISQGRKLLCIGYGFGDEQVNNIIAHAMRESGLELYILLPSDAKQFKDRIHEERLPNAEVIWSGMEGFYPYGLSEILENEKTLNDMVTTFFGNYAR